MALLPFLSTLSKNARIAYPIIRKGVSDLLSGRAIGAVLKEAGLKLRTQTLFDIIREEKNLKTQGSKLKFLPRHRRPNPDRLPKALTPIRNNYGFEVRVIGTQSATGLREEFYITIGSDELLTRGQIEQAAMDVVLANDANYPIILEQIQLTGGFRKGDLGLIPRGDL